MQAWVDGFLSASNIAEEEKSDFLLNAPEIASYSWNDNYCGPKPLDKVMQVVMALKNKLSVRAGGKRK